MLWASILIFFQFSDESLIGFRPKFFIFLNLQDKTYISGLKGGQDGCFFCLYYLTKMPQIRFICLRSTKQPNEKNCQFFFELFCVFSRYFSTSGYIEDPAKSHFYLERHQFDKVANQIAGFLN